MKTSFADSVVVSAIVSTIALAAALFIVIFELSLLWSPMILIASIGAALFIRRFSKKP